MSRTQFAPLLRLVIWSFVDCVALPHCSINCTNLWKKKLLNIKCVFGIYLKFVSEIFYNKKSDRYYHKYTAVFMWNSRYCCCCFQSLIKLDLFSTDFRKNTHVSNLMKIRPAGIELFRANGETYMAKLITANTSSTNQLMLYSEIIAVCSHIHTKHKYTVWAERRM